MRFDLRPGYDGAMSEETPQTVQKYRRLVQRILEGGIPEGKDFDACRAVLRLGTDDQEAFIALFTLLQGALSDPFFGIDETQQVVPILKALSRKEIGVGELL
jgi:hypothetical protein